ncbi:MAG TPA: cytochrome-c oxidase, cbb3-type subunit III [Povalibacter sp.]
MTSFWAGWVIGLLVINLVLVVFLFVWAQRVKIHVEPDGTSGHVWAHGVLREGVRNLPLWWVVISAAALVFALIYFVRYPGFGNYQGTLGWTSAQELERDTEANHAKLEAQMQPLRGLSVDALAGNPAAVAIGHRVYLDNCAACHGAQALGNQFVGAPDLTDADWLYGGDDTTVMTSILDGRNGVMPPLGGVLGHDGVNEAAAYVLSLGGIQAPQDWVTKGKVRFDTLCVACHGADGRGNPALGVPNLTDATWLYGSDFARVVQSIRDGRSGVMPAWRTRLNEDQRRSVVAWMRSRGKSAASVP